MWQSERDSSVLNMGVEFGGRSKKWSQLLLADSLCYSAVVTELGRLAVRMWDGQRYLTVWQTPLVHHGKWCPGYDMHVAGCPGQFFFSLLLQGDGNLILQTVSIVDFTKPRYTDSPVVRPIWESGTAQPVAAPGHDGPEVSPPGFWLKLTDSGVLEIYKGAQSHVSRELLWRNTNLSGQGLARSLGLGSAIRGQGGLVSRNRRFSFALESDGHLVVYDHGNATTNYCAGISDSNACRHERGGEGRLGMSVPVGETRYFKPCMTDNYLHI